MLGNAKEEGEVFAWCDVMGNQMEWDLFPKATQRNTRGSSRVPLEMVFFRDCGVSSVLRAFDAHSNGCTLRNAEGISALYTVRPHVFLYTLRSSAPSFFAPTKKTSLLQVPSIHSPARRCVQSLPC